MGEFIGFIIGVLTVVIIILVFYFLSLVNPAVASAFNSIFCGKCSCSS